MIKNLGYFIHVTERLADWQDLSTRLLGLEVAVASPSRLSLRIDDRPQRLIFEAGIAQPPCTFGWEVADAAALDALAARLEAAGVAVEPGTTALAESRGVRALLVFHDPDGHRLEAYHGAHAAATPFRPTRPLTGFRTGTLGMGHAALAITDMAPMLHFYRDVLGFGVSDYMAAPFAAYFLHLNARHHSLALIGAPRRGLHHLMLELRSFDDLGQTYDLALNEPERVGVTLGRHINDFVTSFYMRTPADFMLEYGWGGRDITPYNWQAEEIRHGASLWGHERYWLPPEKRREALDLRLGAAAAGCKAPVQVLPGEYQVLGSR